MSGLGIDFGSGPDTDLESVIRGQKANSHPSRQSARATGAAQTSRDRFTAIPKKSSLSTLKRSAAAEDKARRVRIASGEPGVLGHGAYTDEDFLSPSSANTGTPSSGSDDFPLDSQRTKRLSAPASGASSSSSSSSSALYSSSSEDSSPGTETSATSFSSASGSSGSALKRTKTLRKHASQPQLSRVPISREKPSGPPPASSKAISKSMSTMNLSSAYKSDSGSSLGRSSEIPRSGSRAGWGRGSARGGSARGNFRGARLAERIGGDAGPAHEQEAHTDNEAYMNQERQDPKPSLEERLASKPEPTARGKKTFVTISDGFGGFIEVEMDPNEPETASVQAAEPVLQIGQPKAKSTGPSLLSRISMDPVIPAPGSATSPSKASSSISANSSQQRQQYRAVGTTAGPPPLPEKAPSEISATQSWKVGSFYDSDGRETACIDATGRVSRTTSANPSLAEDSASSYGGSQRSGDSRSDYGRQRANSVGLPRARLMSSPSQGGDQYEAPAEPSHERSSSIHHHQAVGIVPGQIVPTGPVAMQKSHSSTGMPQMSRRHIQGLEEAERGEAMVSLDRLNKSFEVGVPIMPGNVDTADNQSILTSAPVEGHRPLRSSVSVSAGLGSAAERQSSPARSADKSSPKKVKNRPRRSLSETSAAMLERQSTLLSTTANPIRRSKELNRLLGNSTKKLSASAASGTQLMQSDAEKIRNGLRRSNAVASATAPPAILEQGKAGKARVEVDLFLESDLVVEGGSLRGRMEIKVRGGNEREGEVMLAHPKIRVVGFEELINDDTRHIFYHHASVIDGDRSDGGPSEPYYLHGSPTLSSPEARGRSSLTCFESSPDAEGYAVGREGVHSIPFSLDLPIAKGAKGSYRGKSALVRYIVIGSIKLKNSGGVNRSIAHFYRHIEIYPYFNPAVVLSSAPAPIQASTSKGLFLGGSGKVHLTASLHRSTWVAGQRMYVNVAVANDTSKKVNSLTLALIRTVTLFRPKPELDMAKHTDQDGYIDPDACQTSTTRKKITEETLEMGQRGSKGVVTARGWWTGVEPAGRVDLSYYLALPNEALSISRGRHVEVVYTVKVSVGSSLSSDVSVELPVRIINFVSLDPPPLKHSSGSGSQYGTYGDKVPEGGGLARTWSQTVGGDNYDGQDRMVARVKSMDALRSPGKVEVSLQGQAGSAQIGNANLSAEDREAARVRRLQHQKSLDFINHAIRSATARRGAPVAGSTSGSEPSPMGLGIEIAEDDGSSTPSGCAQTDLEGGATPTGSTVTRGPSLGYASDTASSLGPVHPSCLPFELPSQTAMGMATIPTLHVTNVVTLDEVGDDYDEVDPDRTLNLNEESVDEVDMVIGSSQMDRSGSFRVYDVKHSHAEDPDLSVSIDEGSSTLPDYYVRTDNETVDEDDDESFMEEIPEADEDNVSNGESWSMRRHSESNDSEEEHDAAEVSEIMQTVPQPSSESPETRVESDLTSPRSEPQSQPSVPAAAGRPRASTLIRPSPSPRTIADVIPPVRQSSRPSSPSKSIYGGSPTKSLKGRSGFSFATGQNPVKVQAPSSAIGQPIKAKVNPKQVADKKSPRDGSSPNMGQARKPAQPKSQNKTSHDGGASPADGVGRYRAAQSSSNTQKRSRSRSRRRSKKEGRSVSGSETASDTASSSPATSAGAETPESICSELPQIAGQTFFRARSESIVEAKPMLNSISTPVARKVLPQPPQLPRSVSSLGEDSLASPEKVEGLLRHSASSTSLMDGSGGGGMTRSHSTHSIRGSAIVVPSVRNKIAMLENRSQTLRDFTGNKGGPGSTTSTPSSTPGRVAKLAASAEKAQIQPHNQGQLLSASPSYRLTRKESITSIASSEASTQPDYLRRSNSIMSFKAPVLRSVKGPGR